MSLHASLKSKGGLASVRNVLTRTERLQRLMENKGFKPEDKSVLGLPKTSPKLGVKR